MSDVYAAEIGDELIGTAPNPDAAIELIEARLCQEANDGQHEHGARVECAVYVDPVYEDGDLVDYAAVTRLIARVSGTVWIKGDRDVGEPDHWQEYEVEVEDA